jgi:hypothetical protein
MRQLGSICGSAVLRSFHKQCPTRQHASSKVCFPLPPHTTHSTLQTGLQIHRAWLFLAGFVLGFCLLVEEDNWPKPRQAFSRVRETLKKLSRLSSQAQQYYDILTGFSHAIELYRQQLLARQQLLSNPYVEQIMTFEEESGWQNSGREGNGQM